MRKNKLLPVLAGILAMCAMKTPAQAQWAIVKSSLQPSVRIVEETGSRLVLQNDALNLQMILTIVKESDSDIYADREARRGTNPYRIWTTTELFWSKSALSEGGGEKFFATSFAQTLRMPVQDEPPSAPAPETREEVITQVDSTREPEQHAISRYVMEEQNLEGPDSSSMYIEPVAAQAESTKSLSEPSGALAKKSRAEKVRPQPSPAKSNTRSQKPVPKTERAASRLNVLRPRPTVPTQPAPLNDSTSAASSSAVVPPVQLPAMNPPSDSVPAAVAAIPQRIGSSPFVLGEVFAALILLSSFVFIISLPTTRARFLQWRGNDLAAAAIYEKKLIKSPHRVKLYLALAKIYLRMGRTDENAMKIYKTILQLNLATHEQEKFNAIVAQQYLAEGRTDSEALEIIENALKNNRNRSLPDQFPKK